MKKGMLFLSGVFGLSMIVLILLMMVYIGHSDEPSSDVSTGQEKTTEQSVFLVTLPKEIQLPKWTEEFRDTITQDLLPVNPYSRPGKQLDEVNAVVIHYVGNPGTTAAQNRSYFENIIETKEASVSSHYIVGLEGEIIQCVPLDEISYASNNRNEDTIAIECCHPDETGEFNAATYDSAVKLTAYLCILYNLDPDTDVIRHYDVTGKECPKYFVDYENQWNLFKAQVKRQMGEK